MLKKSLYGLHVQGEVCDDDTYSMYGRLNYGLPTTEVSRALTVPLTDFNGVIQNENVTYIPKTSIIGIEGGARSYLFDGYEFGFALYGGSKFTALIYNISMEESAYDKSSRQTLYNVDTKGKVLAVSVGVTGGAKYSIDTYGTVYLDASADLRLLAIPNNETWQYSSFTTGSLVFTVVLGFRRDIIW